MKALTAKQQEILEFIGRQQHESGVSPTLREIAMQFGFRSMTAAADHVRALRKKGHLAHDPRRARAHRILSPMQELRGPTLDIPVYGSIPAGFAADCVEDPIGCVSVDARTLHVSSGAQLFALRVRGDSMTGRHILDGDCVILDKNRPARPGDVVAALIDQESTLKTFAFERGHPVLRAENPRYPTLIPATDLAIQGVMVGLVRSGG
jgi:repressor LexA